MYKLFPSPYPATELGGWAGCLPSDSTVLGFTAFGLTFLSIPNEGYQILYPFHGKTVPIAPKTIQELEKNYLQLPVVLEKILTPNWYNELVNKLGLLDQDEVFIPNPYPSLGGDCSLESYSKGNYWVFMSLVAASHGLD